MLTRRKFFLFACSVFVVLDLGNAQRSSSASKSNVPKTCVTMREDRVAFGCKGRDLFAYQRRSAWRSSRGPAATTTNEQARSPFSATHVPVSVA